MRNDAMRTAFVDYAKGISIVLVVMMHSTLSSEQALGQTGWLHGVVAFAQPFRIPAFFLIAGLFVARSIDAEWRSFLDRKILHFAYFYVLWLSIQFVFRAPGYAAELGMAGALTTYLMAFIEPFGTLWFIYLLPVFYLVTRLTRPLPPLLVLAVAAALEIAPIQTHWTLIDEFAARFVYFYAGYMFGARILRAAEHIAPHALAILAGLLAFGAVNFWCVQTGIADAAFVSLALGLAGSAAVIGISVLLARFNVLRVLHYCGRNSLAIYLAFFLPMAITRTVLVKTGVITDAGTVSAIVTLTAVIVPLILARLVDGTRLNVLFERPARFRLVGSRPQRLQPAE